MERKKLRIIGCAVLLLAIGAAGAYHFLVERAADRVAPVIEVPADTFSITMDTPVSSLLSGVTAFDDRDGDLTNRIFIEKISKFVAPGKSHITFAAVDASGNVGKKQCTVIWSDYVSPQFDLKQPLRFSSAERINVLDRITAVDRLDGDISNHVKMTLLSGTLAGVGNAEAEVRVTNSMGDTVSLAVNVEIFEASDLNAIYAPEIMLNKYILYLSETEPFIPETMVESIKVRYVGTQAAALGITEEDTVVMPEQYGKNRIRITCETDFSAVGVHEVRYTTSLDGYSGGTTLYVVRGGDA